MLQWSMLDERIAYHRVNDVEVMTICRYSDNAYVTMVTGGPFVGDEYQTIDRAQALANHRNIVGDLLAATKDRCPTSK